MEERKLICINCPLGCPLTVTLNEGEVTSVTGNTCPRGEAYGRKECTHPTRIVTSTVRVSDGTLPVVSVKTASDIPKEKMEECVRQLKAVTVSAPVHIGDLIMENSAGTGVSIVATKNVEKRQK
ncbi:MAG TPA: DUF1667 domain-containing protein [Candidatus Eisenbergiella merdipullorum]|uniref:DUF1667 domain-containing protein n=1 Tax=Candidatus Eisenbergiella merdipullorum TaxID=2838553 RepID=A0A9D2I437_9FIRM|nr:DUF1667 domain-containing protein [Candidatus Eisenbergiella merdipullorum]